MSLLFEILFVIIFMLIITGWVLMLMMVVSNIWQEHRFSCGVYNVEGKEKSSD